MPISISVIIQCLVATSLMTAYSYGLSMVTGKQLREPELLNKLLNPGKPPTRPPGWVIHYIIGLIFIVVYEATFAGSDATLTTYLLAGLWSGLAGIGGWITIFLIHPHPPAIDRTSFYGQLLPAHIIFALSAYLCRQAMAV